MLIKPITRPKSLPLGRLAIDRSHPLARGLISCWVPGIMGGVDLTKLSPPLVPQGSGTFANTKEGPGFKSTATSSGLTRTATSAEKSFTERTLYWRGYINGTSVPDFSVLSGVSYTTTDTNPYVVATLQAGAVSGGQGWLAAWNHGGTVTDSSAALGTVALAVGPLSYGATFVVNGNVTVYNNGASLGTTSFGATGPTSASDATTNINAWVPVNTRNPDGTCSISCMWNRALSAAEMAWLDRDPYAFLVPADPEMGAFRAAVAIAQAITAACATTTTLTKSVGKTIAAASTTTTSFVKQVAKSVSATCASSVSISAIRAYLQTVAASVSSTVTMQRGIAKTVAVSATSTVTMLRDIATTVAVTCTGAVSLVKSVSKTIAAAVAAAVAVGTSVIIGGAYSMTIDVAVSTSVSVSKAMTKTIGVAASVVAAITARVHRVLELAELQLRRLFESRAIVKPHENRAMTRNSELRAMTKPNEVRSMTTPSRPRVS